MSKLITQDELDEMVEEKLTENGWDLDLDLDAKRNKLEEEYEFKLVSEWTHDAEYMIYTETTADGYEIWITTDKYGESNLSPYEHIHYYENDLAEKLQEAIESNSYGTIYTQGLDSDDYYIQEAIEQVFEDTVEQRRDEYQDDILQDDYELEEE